MEDVGQIEQGKVPLSTDGGRREGEMSGERERRVGRREGVKEGGGNTRETGEEREEGEEGTREVGEKREGRINHTN